MSNTFPSNRSFLGDIQQSSWSEVFMDPSRSAIEGTQGQLGLSPANYTPGSLPERAGHFRVPFAQTNPPYAFATRPKATAFEKAQGRWPNVGNGVGFPSDGGFPAEQPGGGQGMQEQVDDETITLSLGSEPGSLVTTLETNTSTSSSSSTTSSSTSTTSCVDEIICEPITDEDYQVTLFPPFGFGTDLHLIDPNLRVVLFEGCRLGDVIAVDEIECNVVWDCPSNADDILGVPVQTSPTVIPPSPGGPIEQLPRVEFEVPDECCVNIPGVEITLAVVWIFKSNNSRCNCQYLQETTVGFQTIVGPCYASITEIYKLECCEEQVVSCPIADP